MNRTFRLLVACSSTFLAVWMTYRFAFGHSPFKLWAKIMTLFFLYVIAWSCWRKWRHPGPVKPLLWVERIGVACVSTFLALFFVPLTVLPEWRQGLDLLLSHRISRFDVRPFAAMLVASTLWFWWQVFRHRRERVPL